MEGGNIAIQKESREEGSGRGKEEEVGAECGGRGEEMRRDSGFYHPEKPEKTRNA